LVDDAPSRIGRRGWIITGAVLVVVIVACALVFVPTRDGREADAEPGSAPIALERLDANDGEPYIGTLGDVSDPVALRRALRGEFRSDDARAGRRGSDTRARRCAKRLRSTDGADGDRLVLLADATLAGKPAVLVAVTDRGRVVAFIADAGTCEVRLAQSL
jgi:hypothetical protein